MEIDVEERLVKLLQEGPLRYVPTIREVTVDICSLMERNGAVRLNYAKRPSNLVSAELN